MNYPMEQYYAQNWAITGILRTDKYGPDGDPLYIVNNQPITRVKVPETLIKKQTTIRKNTRPKGLYG